MIITITVAVVFPGKPTNLQTIPYTSTGFHTIVGGWFDHIEIGNGLVCGFAESPESVASDTGSPADWYRLAPAEEQPCVFMRQGLLGGFDSIRITDLPIIEAMCNAI